MRDVEHLSVHPEPAHSVLTIAEAASLLRISESTIRNAIRSGQLRAFRFGARCGAIRITVADLNDYTTACATTPAKTIKLGHAASGTPFKSLDAGRLLAAWQRQGVLDGRLVESHSPSFGSDSCEATP